MTRPIKVVDPGASKHDRIADAAEFIGRGQRREVFKEIYRHKKRIKTVTDIVAKTGLKRMTVLQRGGELAREDIVHQLKENGDTAYEQITFYQTNKRKILSLTDPKKRAAYPTTRNASVALPKVIRLPTAGAKVRRVTIDDVGSFSKVKKIKTTDVVGDALSEDEFKSGVQTIIGEPGKFKDWGGEQSDLYTTRVMFGGKRRGAAFAFKGPALKGKLVPGRMGKNGDQAQRLFREDADIFFVQHCRAIDPSVVDLMKQLAIVQSIAAGRQVLYGIIDGTDSERLRLAYPAAFVANKKKKKPTPAKRRS